MKILDLHRRKNEGVPLPKSIAILTMTKQVSGGVNRLMNDPYFTNPEKMK